MISPTVKKKMDLLVKLSDKELAWHGFIDRKSESEFFWYDIILYPQYVTAATVTSEADEYAQWIIKQMEFDNFEDMRLHGHSHVNMGCTPSTVDTNYRKELIVNLTSEDYYIFIIVNKRGDYHVEIYDFKSGILFETSDITVIIGTPKDIEEAATWAETVIKNNIKEKFAQWTNYYGYQYPSTTSKAKNSSTPKNSKKKSTSSDAGLWEDPLQNSLLAQA